MSQHPPIPDDVLATVWHEFRYPRPAMDEPTPAFERAMEVVAQWLRGGVVLPMPDESSEDGQVWHSVLGDVLAFVARVGAVVALPASLGEYTPAQIRHTASVFLAAADRAEQLAAEQGSEVHP